MNDLSWIATKKLETLNETSEEIWDKKRWKAYLSPIIEVVSFFETNQLNEQSEEVGNKIVPLIHDQNFILIIDDDAVFISYLKNALEKQGYMVMVARNGKRGLELIYELSPAFVFLDIMLPDINGFSILENINKIKTNLMFVTMISVNNSPENRKKAFDLGAFDFIPKPIDEKVLLAYLENRLAFRKALERSIVTDELTQVFNRKYLNVQIENYTQRFIRKEGYFCLAITDIDFFKEVNDTYGHLVGDEVLKSFASLMLANKREQDIFFRYGGEEFVLLMPNTTLDEAYVEIERLRKLVKQLQFDGNGTPFSVSFSAGVTQVNNDNTHGEILLDQADTALYKAKQSGRNQTIRYVNEVFMVNKPLKVKIIVIDDVYIIRNIIKSYFEKLEINAGYTIEVEAYQDGVSFLQADWYNPTTKYMILLDGIMPEMDGIEVLKQIRSKYSSNDVIISMLTGRIGEEFILEALSLGADDYIVKPFKITDVSTRIIQLINRFFMKHR